MSRPLEADPPLFLRNNVCAAEKNESIDYQHSAVKSRTSTDYVRQTHAVQLLLALGTRPLLASRMEPRHGIETLSRTCASPDHV